MLCNTTWFIRRVNFSDYNLAIDSRNVMFYRWLKRCFIENVKIKRLICNDLFVYFYHLCYTKQLPSPTAQMHEISNASTKQKSSDKYTLITKWLIIDNSFSFLDNKFNAKKGYKWIWNSRNLKMIFVKTMFFY